MTKIRRTPDACQQINYDLVVIGGGVYGVCMALEASRQGLATLLIEKNDFGSATSWNSLRIVHGGLRYLQNLDLKRFRRSVREQAWWLSTFPDLIEPLPCLLPLYNRGLRRMEVMNIALKLNDWLARPIRGELLKDYAWPNSKILTARQCVEQFPAVRREGLKGGAMWFDAKMKSPQRLIIELLRWSSSLGGTAINYMSFENLERDHGKIAAVVARCQVTGKRYRFGAKHVINCCGPWTHELELGEAHADSQSREDCAVAFNVIVKREPLSQSGVAVSPPQRGAPTYFLVPHGERMMIGTEHLPPQRDPAPDAQQIEAFLNQINASIPGLNLKTDDVSQILVGRLPAKQRSSKDPISRPSIVQHRTQGDEMNATSVIGPKYTTARDIAETTLRSIAKQLGGIRRPTGFPQPNVARPDVDPRTNRFRNLDSLHCRQKIVAEKSSAQELQNWMEDESVVHLDDLVLRRLDLDASSQIRVAKEFAATFPWPTSPAEQIERLQRSTHMVKNHLALQENPNHEHANS